MIYIDFTIIMNLKLFSLFQGHPSDWLCKTDESIAEFCYLWQIFVLKLKKREAKSKGKKERHTHSETEFQRIARRDMKAFFSDQYK